MNENDLGTAIVRGACNPEAKSVAVDFSEIALDSLLEEGILKEIPVLKSIIACRKTWQAIHDQLFLRKVAGFVLACPRFTEAEKNRFLGEDLGDPKATKQLGDALVLILDKLDDLEKAPMVKKVFAAYVRGHIGYSDFRRLGAGIGSAFVGDLQTICVQPPAPEINNSQVWVFLEPSGFAVSSTRNAPRILSSSGTRIQIRSKVSSLGKLFQKCMLEE